MISLSPSILSVSCPNTQSNTEDTKYVVLFAPLALRCLSFFHISPFLCFSSTSMPLWLWALSFLLCALFSSNHLTFSVYYFLVWSGLVGWARDIWDGWYLYQLFEWTGLGAGKARIALCLVCQLFCFVVFWVFRCICGAGEARMLATSEWGRA